ncbi:MAG: leucine-rich repeat protein, partial [Spirochaetales bacterium]|nr:leucine-rich repeat protein [Spirochaetales bacterium]
YQVVGTYNDLEINLAYTSEPANGTTLTTVGETTVTLYYNGEKVAEFPITVEKTFLVEFYDGIDNSKPLYTQKVTAGEKPSRPSDPVREDYTFTGWYYDEACSSPATYVFYESAEKDIQLYAGWVKNIYAHDITIKVINLPTEVKALSIWGSLNGWKLANIMADKDAYIVDVINGTAEFYFEKMNIVLSLWCQFVPMTSKDMPMSEATWWQTAFSGSCTWANAENNLVYDETLVNKTTLTLDVSKVYGDVSTVFEKRLNTEDYMKAFQVSVGECKYKIFYEGFDAEEDTYNNNMTSFDDDYDVVLSAPSRYGYTFVGWYETADFSGKPITGWNAGEKKADVTLYAKWEKEEEPVITFNANGGSGTMEEQSVPKGILIGLKENTFTAPDGYLFSHWNTQADGNGISYYDSIKITKDTTLYAQWLKDVPVTGVYSYKLNLDEIEYVWGPRFSVLLLTDEQVAASKEYGKFNFSSKAYQLYSYHDMSIDNIGQPGNYAVYGTNPVDNEYQFYTGVATTVTDTTFEVFVNMSKIVKTELKAFSEMDGINEEEFVTESMPVNLTGYKPYVIALGIQAYDPDNYAMTAWDMDVMKMTAGATFPTDLQYTAPKILTLSDMEYVCSNFGNFPITFTDGIATAEIVYSLENATWKQEVLNGIQFGVCIDEVWSVKFTGANIYSFNTEATLTCGADANNEVYADILTDGMTYVLTIDANAGTVKITPEGADYDNVVTQEVKASELVNTITGLSAGAYKLKVTGTMDSSILTNVKTAMIGNSAVEIALDLGGTTGLTVIPDSAFSGCNLTSIVIPEGVTSIGEYALSCLSDSVTIPSTVTFIDYEAFGAEYSDLKAVYISDLTAWCNMEFGGTFKSNPIEFGAKLYLNNNLVTDLVIPNGVTSIGSEAFAKYQYLTSVTIPDSVETIGWGSFSGCDNLTKVTLGNGVTNIRTGAFSSCSSLKNIAIPDNIVSIEQGAFSGCDNLEYNEYDNGLYLGNSGNSYLVLTKVTDTSITSCTIADTTKMIVDSVFQQCINLESIAIPDSVTTIGSGAFVNCLKLANITIGKGLSSIGLQAFAYIPSTFTVDSENENFSTSEDGKILYNKDKTTLIASTAIGDITIPASVTVINMGALFNHYCKLTSVTFADTTSTWCYTNNEDLSDGTVIDVTDPALNATNLASSDSEYYNKYWYKAE